MVECDTLAKQWLNSGATKSLGRDLKVFYRDYGDSSAAAERTLLVLHGFPESSYSFHRVVDGLQDHFLRVVLFDMPGYGLSDKPTPENYSYSLIDQADVALKLWESIGVKGGHVLAHDMGTSVLTELAYRDAHDLLPEQFSAGIRSYTFTNGSMMLEHADLRIMQKILLSRFGTYAAKLSRYPVFRKQLMSAHGVSAKSDNPENILKEIDIEMLWHFQSLNKGQSRMPFIIRYLNDRKRFQNNRWLPSLKELESKIPIHICWGEADQVARPVMAKELKQRFAPSATLTLMPGVGHFCQLGSPSTWLNAILGFYKEIS